jgi:putative toxin-antitoxin system antitoxin component (TIGR02293 family)
MKQPEFVLTPWPKTAGRKELRSAFRKKWSWVIDSPRSSAVWYSTILSNLKCRYDIPEDATMEYIRQALHEGLSKNEFERLKLLTALSSEQLSKVTRIPVRTLARRQKFKPDESERILRVSSAFQRAIEVLGDLEQARRWFVSPKRALGGKTPLEFCDSEPGALEVMHLLGRIEHGVFS